VKWKEPWCRRILKIFGILKKKCYEVSMECTKKLKDSFTKVGAYSSEQKFIYGDPEGVIQWIGEEVEAFEEILSDHGDFCSFADAWGIATILEKTGCEHVKAAAQAEAIFSANEMKEPSADASLIGGKFYSDVWMKCGHEMADEAIKKSEKESHDAREEAKQAEEGTKRTMISAMIICILFKVFCLVVCF
jgi:hypothetical protein